MWNTEQSSDDIMGSTTPNEFCTAGDTIKITEVSLLFSSVISASPTEKDSETVKRILIRLHNCVISKSTGMTGIIHIC